MTAPPREPVFCPQRKKPCIAGCPYPSECPEPAPSAERAEAERDALLAIVRAADAMYAIADHTGGNPGCYRCDAADDYLVVRAKWEDKL